MTASTTTTAADPASHRMFCGKAAQRFLTCKTLRERVPLRGPFGDNSPRRSLGPLAAYGGSSNLSAVITDPSRSPEAAPQLSKEALAN